jgi:hypothetical protein
MKKTALKLLSLLVAAGFADCNPAAGADLYSPTSVPGGAFILPTANITTDGQAAAVPTAPAISTLDAAIGRNDAFVAPGASSGAFGSAGSSTAPQFGNIPNTLDSSGAGSGTADVFEPNAIPTSRGMGMPGDSGYGAAQYGAMGPAPRTTGTMGPNAPDPNTAGRIVNNSYDGDWFSYCGPRGGTCCNQLYGSIDAYLLDRKDATLKNISVNSTTGLSSLNTADPNFRWDEIAPKLTAGWLFCDWAIEGSVLYTDKIAAHANQRNNNFTDTTFFGLQPLGSNYRNANSSQLDIYDGLHSYELNLVDTRSFFQMIYGFRYIEFREHLAFQSTADATGTSNAEIGTYNRMLGAQIGVRMNYIGELADWEFNLKGGMYQNDQVNSTLIRDNNNTVLLRNTRTGGQNEAYQAEATLALNYRVTNSIKIRFGYQVMYIGEIALTPDQIDPNTVAAANRTGLINDAHGDMFLRGFTGGVEYRW